MYKYTQKNQLSVEQSLAQFIGTEVLPGLGIDTNEFWTSMAQVIEAMTPLNQSLLHHRHQLQQQIDGWLASQTAPVDPTLHRDKLLAIGYLVPEPKDFKINTTDVDPEIAETAGPQLVVPTSNARFALNATNARWGSLYDAYYGTDAIIALPTEPVPGYDRTRGDLVIQAGREFLDQHFTLASGSHADVKRYHIESGQLLGTNLSEQLVPLKTPEQCLGYAGTLEQPNRILLQNHGLRVIIEINPEASIGQGDLAGVNDILLESALTTIQDFEDSVAAVDGPDKVGVYRNWLGLMKGDLTATFNKNGQPLTRKLSPDMGFNGLNGETLIVPGRSVLLCRNVGHLMTTPAILNADGSEVYEGIMDAMISALIALYDLKGLGTYQNSRTGSVYIVKPKMHGPEEVAFANHLFNVVEDVLGMRRHTLKIGVMDEERRTTLNLKACVREVKDRIVFINTGFLDRTGDEIHTCFELGPMARKNDLKSEPWIQAYEQNNIDVGLQCGFQGKAQIGKGMWAMPDEMKQMMDQKSDHLLAGANCAWVPSPTAATLHAIHYHQVNVKAVQDALLSREPIDFNDLLKIPLNQSSLSEPEIQLELENNAQGILGYVVRWVNHGVGCSKVPDINGVGLMEDRATLRISSQHIANWLHHGLITEPQIRQTFRKMAAVVDQQNAHDPNYQPMNPGCDQSPAFLAALSLVFNGKQQPSGYTEPLLHHNRLVLKAS